MIDLYIVRHGETVENTKNLCQGQTEGSLSPKGIEDNLALAETLKDKSFDAVYSSPLNRAKQTCEAVISLHESLELKMDDRLMEWHMGKLQGHEFPAGIDITNNEYEMESADAVRERCQCFINDLQKKHDGTCVLVVTHGLSIKMIEAIVLGKTYHDMKLIGNSSFKRLKLN